MPKYSTSLTKACKGPGYYQNKPLVFYTCVTLDYANRVAVTQDPGGVTIKKLVITDEGSVRFEVSFADGNDLLSAIELHIKSKYPTSNIIKNNLWDRVHFYYKYPEDYTMFNKNALLRFFKLEKF